jgi:hypothetical protein
MDFEFDWITGKLNLMLYLLIPSLYFILFAEAVLE